MTRPRNSFYSNPAPTSLTAEASAGSCAELIVPLHEFPELMEECAELLSREWRVGPTARLVSLRRSCHDFPLSLVLVRPTTGHANLLYFQVIGHSKLSRVLSFPNGLYVESVIVTPCVRGHGYGRRLMEATEQYARARGFETLYLSTYDKQHFYAHIGYSFCAPVDGEKPVGKLVSSSFLQKLSGASERALHDFPSSPIDFERNKCNLKAQYSQEDLCAEHCDSQEKTKKAETSSFQSSISDTESKLEDKTYPDQLLLPPPPPPPPPPPMLTSNLMPFSSRRRTLVYSPPPPPDYVPLSPAERVGSFVYDSSLPQTLDSTPYRDAKGKPIFWMLKQI
uniref:N-alpha-acetyltransferase 80, NatH catalytic subunit n=1 Tax=Eptatretus burgeri TaxID=7764 RepID=A0A8C4WSP3_EPTBU